MKQEFEIGDWVVNEKGAVFQITGREATSWLGYETELFILTGVNGEYVSNRVSWVNRAFHLWTIEDAKDGDVLYCKDNDIEYIVMNKGVNKYGNIDSHFMYNSTCGFDVDIPSVLSIRQDNITPATKEQRDLLFQKLKEAGYEWDAEKKELKKVKKHIFEVGERIAQMGTGVWKIVEVCESWYEVEGLNGERRSIGFDKESTCMRFLNSGIGDCLEIPLPKFNEGDWVVDKIGRVYQVENTCYVIDKNKYGYGLVGGIYICSEFTDYYHLWSIEDAKDGDILVDKNNGQPFIYAGLNKNNKSQVNAYCGLFGYGKLDAIPCLMYIPTYITTDNLRPATKEEKQRLFKKIIGEGYRWDAENKKLVKLSYAFEDICSFIDKNYLTYANNEQGKKEFIKKLREKFN